MNSPATLSNHTQPGREAGLSLIELMISLTIGLVLLLGITSLIVQQSSARNELEKSSRQIENGRYAMQILHDDIEHAGFYSKYTPVSGVPVNVPADPCDMTVANLGWAAASGVVVSVPSPVFGYAGGGADPTPGACLLNYKPNTAVLVVRRTVTASIAAAAADGASIYLQTSRCNTDTGGPFIVNKAGFVLRQGDCSTLSALRQYLVDIYYISSCDDCASDNIPTLKMVRNGGNATPLVEGIENMQFDYGLDNTGDGAPDSFDPSPAAADWQNVMAIRVNLLARNLECTAGYTDSKSYNLGGMAGAVSGIVSNCSNGNDYKRHVYTGLVRVVNPSAWRE